MVFDIRDSKSATGILLIASFLILVLALIITVAGGALPAFADSLQSVESLEQMAPYAAMHSAVHYLYGAGWIVLLLGYGLLTRLLLRGGGEGLAIVAFIVILVAAVLGVIEASLRGSLTIWAAEEATRTGSIPDFYMALRGWSDWIQRVHMSLAHLSLAGYGWALLRSGLLPPGIGWASIAWGGFWLLALGVAHVGFPALVFIMPVVIGIALLTQSQSKRNLADKFQEG